MMREYLAIEEFSSSGKFISKMTKNSLEILSQKPSKTDSSKIDVKGQLKSSVMKAQPIMVLKPRSDQTRSKMVQSYQHLLSEYPNRGVSSTPQFDLCQFETNRDNPSNKMTQTLYPQFEKTSEYLSMEVNKIRVNKTRIALQMPKSEFASPTKTNTAILHRVSDQRQHPAYLSKLEGSAERGSASIPIFPVFHIQTPGMQMARAPLTKMVRIKSRSMAGTDLVANIPQVDSPRLRKSTFQMPIASNEMANKGVPLSPGFRVHSNVTPTHSRNSSQSSKMGSTQYMAFMKAKRQESCKRREISELDLKQLKQNTTLNWDSDSLPADLSDIDLGFRIGAGNFAQVYEAYDKLLQRSVAVKVFENHKVINTAGWKSLLQKEITTMANLPAHENVCTFYRVLQDKKKVEINLSEVYIVLEYCGSQTIQKLVDERGRSESLLRDIFRNILEGLRFLHANGVAHRDLKPSNILINSKGVAKIIDLGLCSDSNSSETVYCGTPAYMNPQMAERRPYLAPKHDTWCIGMMLFFLKFGRHPFGGRWSSPRQKQPQLQAMAHTIVCSVSNCTI
jgi:Protein kinase domain